MTRHQNQLLWTQFGISALMVIFTFVIGWRRVGLRRIVPVVIGMAVYMAILSYLSFRFGPIMLLMLFSAGFVVAGWAVYSSYPNWAPYFGFKSTRPPKDYWQLRRPGVREP